MGARLDIQDLAVRLGPFELRDVTLSVGEREVFALLGRTGSGKSVLLETVAGAYDPDEGRVLIDGVDVTKVPVRQRDVGVVYQDCALFPHLSVVGNVAYGLECHGVKRAEAHGRALAELDRFGVAHLGDRSPLGVSGGEAQRVALARAMVLRPRLLLMDEPFSALDPTTREDMYEVVRTVNQEYDCTIVFVTHDFYEAQLLADRIAIILDGRLRAVVPSGQLFTKGCDEDVAAFLGRNRNGSRDRRTA